MELGLPSDYEGRLWAPSPKHQASNKPGTPETTLADMVLGLTWIASRCCLIFLRMQCRPVETRPNDFGWDPSKDDPGKLHGGPSQVERMRAVAREQIQLTA